MDVGFCVVCVKVCVRVYLIGFLFSLGVCGVVRLLLVWVCWLFWFCVFGFAVYLFAVGVVICFGLDFWVGFGLCFVSSGFWVVLVLLLWNFGLRVC